MEEDEQEEPSADELYRRWKEGHQRWIADWEGDLARAEAGDVGAMLKLRLRYRSGRLGLARDMERVDYWTYRLVYDDGDEKFLTTYKKPHAFEYNGNLWHHLGKFVRSVDVLSRVRSWVCTSTDAFERAIRKVEPKQSRVLARLKGATPVLTSGGPYCTMFDTDCCTEAFFDEKAVKTIT